MSDETKLRNMARAAMQAGKLPRRRPKRMWGGPGIGAPCVICAEPVKQDELGFELEFAPDHEDTGEGDCHVHLRCFAAWEFERRHFDVPRMQGGSSPAEQVGAVETGNVIRSMSTQILPAASNDGTICVHDDRTVPASERDATYRGGTAR